MSTATAFVRAAVVRVSGPREAIEFKRVERITEGADRLLMSARAAGVDSIDDGDRGGKPFLIRFFRELR